MFGHVPMLGSFTFTCSVSFRIVASLIHQNVWSANVDWYRIILLLKTQLPLVGFFFPGTKAIKDGFMASGALLKTMMIHRFVGKYFVT